MNRREFSYLFGAAAVTSGLVNTAAVAAPGWALKADVAECCGCPIPCPCNFGLKTKNQCNGNRLIEITEGHIDDADLSGIRFLATFEMGKWVRISLDDSLSAAQTEAFERIYPVAFGGFKKFTVAQARVPMQVTRGAQEIRFSVPDSEVQMKLMPGLNGKPITIENLPSPAYHNYTQFVSVVHRHKSEHGEFSHADTNGFTSVMIAAG